MSLTSMSAGPVTACASVAATWLPATLNGPGALPRDRSLQGGLEPPGYIIPSMRGKKVEIAGT